MKGKLFSSLVLLALFGSALGFFGIVYEGIVYGPKMMDTSLQRLIFWRDFYSVISPVIYYIPLYPLSMVLTVFLFFMTPGKKASLKPKIMFAAVFQLASFAITLYILTQLHLKMYFSEPERYAGLIPAKTTLFNVLSVLRIALSAAGVSFIFRAYIITQQEQALAGAEKSYAKDICSPKDYKLCSRSLVEGLPFDLNFCKSLACKTSQL